MANFHVEFGINETQLTRLLERGLYREAENLILENNSASYLDEGCYQRTPLFIVLSGQDETCLLRTPRNFYLARLLVQFGACVNYRVPLTDGAEFVSPGRTPLELAVNFYLELQQQNHSSEILNTAGKSTEPTGLEDYIVGLGNERLRSVSDVQDDLLDLILTMLSNGGDTAIRDGLGQTLLHRAVSVLGSDDLRLVHLLLESNVDLNSVDHKGNTPLMSLCELKTDHLRKLARDWSTGVTELLLQQESIQLNKQNKDGRTAVFSAMLRGNIPSANLLLRSGAVVSPQGRVGRCDEGVEYPGTLYLSPLLAYLCSPRASTEDFHGNSIAIAHLVDSGYFSNLDVIDELLTHLDDTTSHLSDSFSGLGTTLVNLLFGGTSAGLRQLCVRAVFQHHFLKAIPQKHREKNCDSEIVEDLTSDDTNSDQFSLERTPPQWLRHPQISEDLITQQFHLPRTAKVYFEVELFKRRLAWKLNVFRYPGKQTTENTSQTFSESDELSSSDDDESDGEFW